MGKTIRREATSRNNVAWGHIMTHASNPKAGAIPSSRRGKRAKDARVKRDYMEYGYTLTEVILIAGIGTVIYIGIYFLARLW